MQTRADLLDGQRVDRVGCLGPGLPRGRVSSANIITEEDSQSLIIPSHVMQRLANQYAGLHRVFYATMAQRLSKIELPLGTHLNQDLLRELCTIQPDMEEKPAAAQIGV